MRREAGALERDVLACLAAHGEPLSPAEVQTELAGDLAYTTVMTTLSRLHAKRALVRTARGRGYVYSLPDTTDTAHASMAAFHMQRLLDGQSDRAGVLAQFVANLRDGDEELLEQVMRQTRQGKRGRQAKR
jgi:predicted transcriptional regulator